MTALAGALYVCALLLGVPVSVLIAQIWLAARPVRTSDLPTKPTQVRPKIAVLVPAHNEQEGLLFTLQSLKLQLGEGDRLLVVADNCSDNTAALARSAGAEVVERFNTAQQAKGYALDYGVRHLAAAPPDVLVIVDADCQLGAGAVELLARAALFSGRPVQALNLMKAPANAGLKLRLAEFAWRIKNWVRPLGWQQLNWPCQLMGTGMAFPWTMAQRMDLANGDLVEDMKLGANLAMAGTPPLFCVQALVTSEFPVGDSAQKNQRKRWEHGHLTILRSLAPRLLWGALHTRNVTMLAMALDLMVPPVTLLAALLGAVWTTALAFALWPGVIGPFLLATFVLLVFVLSIFLAWHRWGRTLVSGPEWLQVPIYLVFKLPLYLGYLFRRQKTWVRTERHRSGNDGPT